jgi:hypothetical protein
MKYVMRPSLHSTTIYFTSLHFTSLHFSSEVVFDRTRTEVNFHFKYKMKVSKGWKMQECPTLSPKSPSQKFLTISQMRIWQQNRCRIHIQCDVEETPLPKFNAYCDPFVWSKTQITSRPNKLISQDRSCAEGLPHTIASAANSLRWWGTAIFETWHCS